MASIESGFMQHEIGDSAYQAQRALEEKRAIVVGVNEFTELEGSTLPTLVIDESVERDQVARLQAFRERRARDWRGALSALHAGAQGGANLMGLIVDAVRNDCTVGEIVSTLKRTFGEHRDQGF
jgi:methylmalonyl-CoA mutase N-terminal domain/subunit